MNRRRPMMIYDGDCHFCTRWIERWRAITGDAVEYRASQDGGIGDVPPEVCERSVQFVDADGRRFERARAVFLALATATLFGRMLDGAYRVLPGFAGVSDAGYDFIARNRSAFSWLTRALWGRDVRPPTYAVSTMIFLRMLAVVYFIAFLSFGVQSAGLVGENGILPVKDALPRVAEAFGGDAWRMWPTLVWLGPPDTMLFLLTCVGLVCAVSIFLGVLQPLALAGAWAAYLSLVVAGQVFYSFQWDSLLLETGLLAIFVAPWTWRPSLQITAPSKLGHFLLIWLLFRVMFSSGVVKLSSGDPTWANLTALDYHYFTQPLPNPIAWFAAQAPAWFQKISCGILFAVELILPFFVFLPRRLRCIAFLGFVGLELLIELTGNYGFFSLLTVALAVLLLDDALWPRLPRLQATSAPRARCPGWLALPAAVAIVALSLVPLAGAFRVMPPPLTPLLGVYEWLAPFRIINGYGLFAVMTTERPEILVQGSVDGREWRTYAFKFKPGAADRRPPFVAPYMPRLDWQMWFAALGDVRQSPWFFAFAGRLLEAEPAVLDLLEPDPFDGRRPRYLRALLDDYMFTTSEERRQTGNWWKAEPRAVYLREVGL